MLMPEASCADPWRACMPPGGERWMLRLTLVRRGLLGRRREEGDLANSRTTGMSDGDSLALCGVLACELGRAAVGGGVLAAVSSAMAICAPLNSAEGFMLIAQTDGGAEVAAGCSSAFGPSWQDDGALGAAHRQEAVVLMHPGLELPPPSVRYLNGSEVHRC